MDFYAWLKAQWDRVAAAALAVAGVVALYLGYNGVSHSTLPSQQIPYLASGGLLAVLFLGGAATLWLSADLRDEWRKLDEIHRELRVQRDGAPEENGPPGPGSAVLAGEPTRPVTVVAEPVPADHVAPQPEGEVHPQPADHLQPEPVAFAAAPRRAPRARPSRRPSASK